MHNCSSILEIKPSGICQLQYFHRIFHMKRLFIYFPQFAAPGVLWPWQVFYCFSMFSAFLDREENTVSCNNLKIQKHSESLLKVMISLFSLLWWYSSVFLCGLDCNIWMHRADCSVLKYSNDINIYMTRTWDTSFLFLVQLLSCCVTALKTTVL